MANRPFNLGIDPADAQARLQQLLQPGYARGGLREAIAEMEGPEAQGASSPSFEGMGEALSGIGAGISDIYSTPEADLSAYTKAPELSVRRDITPVTLGAELNARDYGAGSPSWEDVGEIGHAIAEDPFAAIGGALPVVGNMLAAADVAKMKDKIAELRASGENEKADLYQRHLPLAAAGVVMPAGGGMVTRAALKGAEKAAAMAAEKEGLRYATRQEGPFYRVRHSGADELGATNRGVKEILGDDQGIASVDAGGSGSVRDRVPKSLSDEEIQAILKSPEDNRLLAKAAEHTGSDFQPVKMPESSLAKESAIGRAFEIAADGSPEYKASVFEAYKREMPDVVKEAGAKNYDELLAASYKQMAKETKEQFDTLPLSYSFHKNGEGNYASSAEMAKDVHGNGHLYVFQGGDPHDFLHNVDPRTGLNENEMFRAVHDAYGHAVHGNQFGPKGEEIAWGLHQQMYSPLARLAMTAETRGQNSFVNYTPVNAKLKEYLNELEEARVAARRNRDPEKMAEIAKLKKETNDLFQYAPQKAVLLPPEFVSTEYAGGMPAYLEAANRPKPGTAVSAELTHFSPEAGLTELDPARYGTGIPGAERSRLINKKGETVPGATRDRTYFYTSDPEKVIPEAGLGQNRYKSSSDSLYDIVADPRDFKKLARESLRSKWDSNFNPGTIDPNHYANTLDRLIQEYGYEGMMNPNAAFPMATVFKPKAVEPFAYGGSVDGAAEAADLDTLYQKYEPDGYAFGGMFKGLFGNIGRGRSDNQYEMPREIDPAQSEQPADAQQVLYTPPAVQQAQEGPVYQPGLTVQEQEAAETMPPSLNQLAANYGEGTLPNSAEELDQPYFGNDLTMTDAESKQYDDMIDSQQGGQQSFDENNIPLPPTKPSYLQNFDYSQYADPLSARYAYLSKALNPTIAAAAMGNFQPESFNNPTQFQTSNGTQAGKPIYDRNNMPLGYGSAQWGGARLTNPNGGENKMGLFDFADRYGFDPNTTEGQDRFLVYELTQNPEYRNVYKNLLKSGNDVAGAAYVFGKGYENPANLPATLKQRQQNAAMYQKLYSNGMDSLTPAQQQTIAETQGKILDPYFKNIAENKAIESARLEHKYRDRPTFSRDYSTDFNNFGSTSEPPLTRQSPEVVAETPKADNEQVALSGNDLSDVGFNPVADTSVNDRIMQDSNDYLNKNVQDSLNYNYQDPFGLLSSGLTQYVLPDVLGGSGRPGGSGGNDGSGSSLSILNDFPSWYTEPYAEGGKVGFNPMFDGDSEIMQTRAKQLAKQAYTDPKKLSSSERREWNELAGKYNLPPSANSQNTYEEQTEETMTGLQKGLSSRQKDRSYARGGLVYDPAEIDSIAAQIRGVN